MKSKEKLSEKIEIMNDYISRIPDEVLIDAFRKAEEEQKKDNSVTNILVSSFLKNEVDRRGIQLE